MHLQIAALADGGENNCLIWDDQVNLSSVAAKRIKLLSPVSFLKLLSSLFSYCLNTFLPKVSFSVFLPDRRLLLPNLLNCKP